MKCKTCKYELVETKLLPCCICGEINEGHKDRWTPKKREEFVDSEHIYR